MPQRSARLPHRMIEPALARILSLTGPHRPDRLAILKINQMDRAGIVEE